MRNLLFVLLILLVIAGLLLFPSALRFRESLGAIPPGVRVAGTSFGSADAANIASTLETTFSEPVAVYYAGQRLILRPQMVGFTVDVPSMLSEAQQYKGVGRLVLVFFGQLIGRPPRPVELPLHYTLNRDALDNWLSDVASRYDRTALTPQPVLARLTIQPGQPGWHMDVPASRDRVVAALTAPQARTADLVVRESVPDRPDSDILRELLAARLKQFPGIGSLFLHDTNTGTEVALNAEVAYSAMGTMKLAILEETYRKLDRPPNAETRRIISETMTLAGNQTADALLGMIGNGDALAGARSVSESLQTLGLKNSFIAGPYEVSSPTPPHVVTPANSRHEQDTRPDPYMQTTAREMGLLMEMMVECSRGGGTFLAAYRGQLTPDECLQGVDYLVHNQVPGLLIAGIPPGTRIAFKQGYAQDTHGEVAAIWGPAGPYILSVFLYNGPTLDWQLSATTMQELSQAVWNYYQVVSPAAKTQ